MSEPTFPALTQFTGRASLANFSRAIKLHKEQRSQRQVSQQKSTFDGFFTLGGTVPNQLLDSLGLASPAFGGIVIRQLLPGAQTMQQRNVMEGQGNVW
jgi:hypothetical protein